MHEGKISLLFFDLNDLYEVNLLLKENIFSKFAIILENLLRLMPNLIQHKKHIKYGRLFTVRTES